MGLQPLDCSKPGADATLTGRTAWLVAGAGRRARIELSRGSETEVSHETLKRLRSHSGSRCTVQLRAPLSFERRFFGSRCLGGRYATEPAGPGTRSRKRVTGSEPLLRSQASASESSESRTLAGSHPSRVTLLLP
jgi:hypothetical protein